MKYEDLNMISLIQIVYMYIYLLSYPKILTLIFFQLIQPPLLQTNNPTATPLVNPKIEQAKQVNLAPAKPDYHPIKQRNPDQQQQQHYLGDLEDGEDTSQDAADLVSSHDEVKIETALQEVIPKYQLIQQLNPQNQLIQPKSPEKQRAVPANNATPQNLEMPKIKTEEKLPAKVEVQTTATAALVTAAEPVKPRSKLALPKAVSKPAAEPKTAEKKPVAVIETKPVKPVANPPQISKLISKSKMEEDENFMIESDNVDENLYSSETTDSSDSTSDSSSKDAKKAAASKPENIQPKPKLRFSSSSSLEEKKPQVKPANLIQDKPANPVAKPVQAPLNLHSDSDSPEMEQKQVSGTTRAANLVFTIPQAAEDLDISGPENELDDDDFWN